MRQDEEEETRAVAEVNQAKREVWQCAQTKDLNGEECVLYFQAKINAKAEIERIKEEGRRNEATDNDRQLAARG
eukprot:5106108-Heterocapsa_arctica.AAC.1